ncbi:MAG: 16S rRNA (cytosine(1402)-N(4))-methyltransferase RsmH [Phycisphaerales bacterium]
MSAAPETGHVPVLAEKVVAGLAPVAGETFVDCTAGLGGHAALLAARVGPGGRVILLDVDRGNLERAEARLRSLPGGPAVEAVHANFSSVGEVLRARGITAHMVLADLGFSSTQMDDPERGFSFQRPGPLDMRLDPGLVGTAADLVNALPEARLADLIHSLGEEPFARRIARTLVAARQRSPIRTTTELADLVRKAYGARAETSRMHPATRTFMALRIAVNGELAALERLLDSVGEAARAVAEGRPAWLAPAARVGIISFHSLEDRMVKQAFAGLPAGAGRRSGGSREPLTASEEEVRANPRARSAKLRFLTLIGRC